MAKKSVIGRLLQLLTKAMKSTPNSRRNTSTKSSTKHSGRFVKSPTRKGGKTRKPRGKKVAGSPPGGEPVVKRILEEGKHLFDLVFSGKEARECIQLIHRGDSWNTPFRDQPAITMFNDGNGLNVTYHGNPEMQNVRLQYHEAFDLAVALLEYTKSDKYMPNPAYEVI